MITLQKGNTETVIFTGTEQCLLTDPYFLFVFTNREGSGDEVKLVKENTSERTDRYDKVSIVVNTHFTDKTEGLWKYEIYEQASSSNTDTTGLNKVEEGLMMLKPATAFAHTTYETEDTIYKSYQ
jgi:hypothetical protein